jgi:Tfp pilus assembly protein PilV
VTPLIQNPSPARSPKGAWRRARRRGFTLIEAAWVTVIVGVGTVGMLELLAAGTMSNAAGTEMSTALNLANNVHEISLGLAFADPQNPTVWTSRESDVTQYDNITDLDGQTFSPPLDVSRQPMAGYSNWSQKVTVQTVAADQVNSVRPNSISIPTAKVTVQILRNNKIVHQTSWLVVGPSPG